MQLGIGDPDATTSGRRSPMWMPPQPPRSPTAMSRLELELLDRSVFFPRVRSAEDVGSSSDSAGQQEEVSKDSDGDDDDSWVDPHEYRPSKRSHYNPIVPRLDLGDLSRSLSCEANIDSAGSDEPATPMAPRAPPAAVRELAAAAAAAAAARTPRVPPQRQASQPHPILHQNPRNLEQQQQQQQQQKPPMSAPPGPKFGGYGAPNWGNVIQELKGKPRPGQCAPINPPGRLGSLQSERRAFASQGRQQIETAISQLRPRPSSLHVAQRVGQPLQQQQRTLSPGPQSSQLQDLLPPPTLPKPKCPTRPHPMAAASKRQALPEVMSEAPTESGAIVQMRQQRSDSSRDEPDQIAEKPVGDSENQPAEADQPQLQDVQERAKVLEAEQSGITEREASQSDENKSAVSAGELSLVSQPATTDAELAVIQASAVSNELPSITAEPEATGKMQELVSAAPAAEVSSDLPVSVALSEGAATSTHGIEPQAAADCAATAEEVPPTAEEELQALAELLSVEPQEAKTISDALAGRGKQPKSEEEKLFERLDKTEGLSEEELVKVAQLMNMDQETAKAVARFLITQQPGDDEAEDEETEADTENLDETDTTVDTEWERLQQRYFDDPDEFRFVRPLRDAAGTRDGAESNVSRGSSGATGSDIRQRMREFGDLLLGFDNPISDDASVGDDATSERSFDVDSMRFRFERLMSFSDRASVVSSDRTSLAPSSASGTHRRRRVGARSVSRTSSQASSLAPSAAVAAANAAVSSGETPAPVQAVGRPVRRAQSDALRNASQLQQIVQIKRMIERRRQQQSQAAPTSAADSQESPTEHSTSAAQHRISEDNRPPAAYRPGSPSPPSLPPPTVFVEETPSDDGADAVEAFKKPTPVAEDSATNTAEVMPKEELATESSSQQPPAGEIRLSVSPAAGGALTVHVIECRGLRVGDARKSRTDSYAKLLLLPDRLKKKTKVKKNTANPVFDESFKFPAPTSPRPASRQLLVSVWQSTDFLQSDQLLGDCRVDLGSRPASTQPSWHQLGCHSRRSSQQEASQQISGELVVAVRLAGEELQVLVKEALGLASFRPAMEPFVKLYLLPDRSKRGKRKTTTAPIRGAGAGASGVSAKWSAALKFDGVDADSLAARGLEFSVWDGSGPGSLGHLGHLGYRQYLGGALLSELGSLVAGGGWAEARLQLRDLRQQRAPAAE
ncbi:hypothetical protein BOX15_Mlig012651g1 [Macrostomum lignano]|uniref:C2 domain-containing protein n=1 Tax=Macrostomum lignano TaxID=282301 RepID=A0A267GT55_9PLAT|nr:hypothetical protein BOX15_Mlig012651g1 [Macrostomum lignano]